MPGDPQRAPAPVHEEAERPQDLLRFLPIDGLLHQRLPVRADQGPAGSVHRRCEEEADGDGVDVCPAVECVVHAAVDLGSELLDEPLVHHREERQHQLRHRHRGVEPVGHPDQELAATLHDPPEPECLDGVPAGSADLVDVHGGHPGEGQAALHEDVAGPLGRGARDRGVGKDQLPRDIAIIRSRPLQLELQLLVERSRIRLVARIAEIGAGQLDRGRQAGITVLEVDPSSQEPPPELVRHAAQDLVGRGGQRAARGQVRPERSL